MWVQYIQGTLQGWPTFWTRVARREEFGNGSLGPAEGWQGNTSLISIREEEEEEEERKEVKEEEEEEVELLF